MRLITIGRSTSSTICINNEYVSSNHATILLLDNGDIFLMDCDSLHGTYLFGKKITPNTEVPIKRGDRIDFDKVPLNWSQVPTIPIPDPSVVKGVYGIGKSRRNRYQLSGDSVSRYHATFKEMKNGQWFITDHSTNGTYVNGQRISSNTEYRIKANDSIMCGNVPCPNPIPSRPIGNILKYAGISVAAVAAIVAIVLVLPGLIGSNIDPAKATVLVRTDYQLMVKFKNGDAAQKVFGCRELYILDPDFDKKNIILLRPEMRNRATTYSHVGTAFFVSDDGIMLTNKHVTNPVWADKVSGGGEFQEYRKIIEEVLVTMMEEADYVDGNTYDLFKSGYDIETALSSFSISHSGRAYSSISEFDYAHLLAESSDDNIDIAILCLNDKKTPKDADFFNLKRIVPISKLKRDETYYSVGYPGGFGIGYRMDKNDLKLSYYNFHLTQDPSAKELCFQGDKSIGGQSGSPIYDKKKRLVGILWGGNSYTESTFACPIFHAVNLLEDVTEQRRLMGDYYDANK